MNLGGAVLDIECAAPHRRLSWRLYSLVRFCRFRSFGPSTPINPIDRDNASDSLSRVFRHF